MPPPDAAISAYVSPCSRRLNSDSRKPAKGMCVCESTKPGIAVAPRASKSSSILCRLPCCGPASMTITGSSSYTSSFRIAPPRTGPRPRGVAICFRLRTRSSSALHPLPEHARDRLLGRFLLGVERDDVLHGVERSLEAGADGGALDLEVLDRALDVGDALHRLSDHALAEQLGVLDDQLRLFAGVALHVFRDLLRREERVLQDALALRVIAQLLGEHGVLAREGVAALDQPLD